MSYVQGLPPNIAYFQLSSLKIGTDGGTFEIGFVDPIEAKSCRLLLSGLLLLKISRTAEDEFDGSYQVGSVALESVSNEGLKELDYGFSGAPINSGWHLAIDGEISIDAVALRCEFSD